MFTCASTRMSTIVVDRSETVESKEADKIHCVSLEHIFRWRWEIVTEERSSSRAIKILHAHVVCLHSHTHMAWLRIFNHHCNMVGSGHHMMVAGVTWWWERKFLTLLILEVVLLYIFPKCYYHYYFIRGGTACEVTSCCIKSVLSPVLWTCAMWSFTSVLVCGYLYDCIYFGLFLRGLSSWVQMWQCTPWPST